MGHSAWKQAELRTGTATNRHGDDLVTVAS